MTSSTIKSRILCMYKHVLKSVKTVFSINSSNASVSLALLAYFLNYRNNENISSLYALTRPTDKKAMKSVQLYIYIYIYHSFSPNSIMMEQSKWNTHGISDARDHNLIDHVNRAWLRNGPTSGNHSALPLVVRRVPMACCGIQHLWSAFCSVF